MGRKVAESCHILSSHYISAVSMFSFPKRENIPEKRYPFQCDFYVKSQDMFIEVNGNWTHGDHPFDSNNEDDLKTLKEWEEKAKTSKYYQNAIYTWTDLDVRKQNFAKENNLNYP